MPEQGEVFARSSIVEERTADAVAIALASADRRLDETAERLRDADAEQRTLFDRILVEQREATKVAEQEREKAANALRTSLEHEIKAGDSALREHIAHQVEQVRQALASLQLLLNERDGRMDDRFQAHREAITKAEDSMNLRILALNEFRQQAQDRDAQRVDAETFRSELGRIEALINRNREDISDQRGTYLPMSAFTAQTQEWTSWRQVTDEKLTKHQASIVGRDGLDDILGPLREKVEAMQSWQFKIAGALVFITVILPMVVAFAVYLLTRHAVPVDNGLAK